MTWSSLIVYVDDEPDNVARIKLACDLARKHHAHLIGVSACAPVTPVVDGGDALGMLGEIIEVQNEWAHKALMAAEVRFREICAHRGLSCEWRGALGDPSYWTEHHARAADALIVGFNSDANSGWRGVHTVDLVMHTGRPVMVVPNEPAVSPVHSPVLLTWNDSRECRHAASAALPFLQKAPVVRIVELADARDLDGARQRITDVGLWLHRHGVRAELDARAYDGRPTGRQLVDCAREMEAGAIVSGAWGHARMRQWFFGGVTQSLMAEASISLILVH